MSLQAIRARNIFAPAAWWCGFRRESTAWFVQLLPNCRKDFRRVLDDGQGEPAELVDAFLPYANGKSSEVRRVFADKGLHRVHISNKHFGLIERHDDLALICCMIDGELIPTALRVYNEHNEERDAYIFAQEYLERLGMYMEV